MKKLLSLALKKKGLSLAVLAVTFALCWYGWYALKKQMNYSMQYGGKVNASICDAVKPEHRHILTIKCN